MKLNKLQRHTAYILLLLESDSYAEDKNYERGLCHLINDLFGLYNANGSDGFHRVIADYFPELQAKRPVFTLINFWFSRDIEGWNERKNLLKQCIEETY